MPNAPRLEPNAKLNGAGREKPSHSPLPKHFIGRAASGGGHHRLAEAVLLSSQAPVPAPTTVAVGVSGCSEGAGQPREMLESGENRCIAETSSHSHGLPRLGQEASSTGVVATFGLKDAHPTPVECDSTGCP